MSVLNKIADDLDWDMKFDFRAAADIISNDKITVIRFGGGEDILGSGTFFTILAFPKDKPGVFYKDFAASSSEELGIVQNFLNNPDNPPYFWDERETYEERLAAKRENLRRAGDPAKMKD